MISEEDELPYKRPQLSKHMFDGTDEAAKAEFFTLYDAQWYADRNIQLDFGQRITALNPSAKQVTMEDGTVYEYDKCICALGSHFFVPPFQGCDQPKVKTIRTLKDIQDVNGFLTHRKQAVVIGASNHAEIWEPSKWDEAQQSISDDDIRELLEQINYI